MSDLPHRDERKEVANSLGIATQASASSFVYDPVLEKRIWRKLDLYVVPIVAMFYLLAFLDRTSIGNARVAGLQRDLKMSNRQYSMALTITYIPYIIAELPTNLLLRSVGPNIMLPTMLILWGVVTTLQGGITPGLVLYLSLFYPRHKLNSRLAAVFSSASPSGVFSGILASGIIKIKESSTQTRHGWSWIFIIEGLFTVIFGLASYILLPRSPGAARFFTPEERDYIVGVLQGETVEDDESFSWHDVGRALVAPQVIIVAIIFFFAGIVLFGLAFFVPSIIVGLGYTASAAQLVSIPPYAVAFVVAILFAFISDHYKCRGLILIIISFLCTIGFAMFLGSDRQTALFYLLGHLAIVPPTHATAIATGFITSNVAGILVTWLLGSLSAAPRYRSATIVLLISSVGIGLFSGANVMCLARQNRLKAEVRRTLPRVEERKGMGDRSAWFEYIV
ncbi:MFS general substrate transporter [Pleurotus eryngii]|uniref:MFS general substrate transporter n=1 Tax=Pleurotus eryngii TaxID=5323 RepID=A0A9P5ZVC5_PLEER|nr:MFS general substrate transporter [Pleurotus eryngii]